MRRMPTPGSAADVAAELKLHGLRADASARRVGQVDIEIVALRNTPLGDLEAWVRADDAHFFGPLDYPDRLVPVVDADLWDRAAPRPRLLFVVSRVTRAMLVCSPRRTWTAWTRRSVTGPRGFMLAMTCPREQTKSLHWLKNQIL